MENSNKIDLDSIINLIKSSERKYKEIDFKGAIEDKRKVKSILDSASYGNEIREKINEEINKLYYSKFDLIYDHKKKITQKKKKELIKLLEKKSDEKYKNGDYKGAIKSLRRSEKYK